jgi:S1-C subfamily serine protease
MIDTAPQPVPDYYEILQFSPNADPEIIQAGYKRLVDRWNANRKPGDPSAFEQLAILDEASAVLSDPLKRQHYDLQRRQAATNGVGEEQPSPTDSGTTTPSPSATHQPPAETSSSSESGLAARKAVSPVAWTLLTIGTVLVFFHQPLNPLLFIDRGLVWSLFFGIPAVLCFGQKKRSGITVVAILFFLAAGLDVCVGFDVSVGEVVTPDSVDESPADIVSRINSGTPAPKTLQLLPPSTHEGVFLKMEVLEGGRSEWDDPKYTLESRVQDFFRTHAKLDTQPEEVHTEANRRFGIDPGRAAQGFGLEVARQKEEGKQETATQRLGRVAVPFVSAVRNWQSARQYSEAVANYTQGKAIKEDLAVIARFERVQPTDALKRLYNPVLAGQVAKPPLASGPTSRPPPQSPLSAEELFARASPAVVQVVIQDRSGHTIGSGSGFLLDKNGLVATNYHVIEKAHTAHLLLADKTKLPVLGVAALDEEADIAIIQVKGRVDAHPLELAGNDLSVGAKVYAIGNPLGLANTLSDGLISGYRKLDTITLIQTSAPLSPGSSGGPLMSADGRVIGVTTSGFKGGQNLNFAVPISRVSSLVASRGRIRSLPIDGGRSARNSEREQTLEEERKARSRDARDRQSRNSEVIQEIMKSIEAVDDSVPRWAHQEWRAYTNLYWLGKLPAEIARDAFFELLIKMDMNEKVRIRGMERSAAACRMTVTEYCEDKGFPLPVDHGSGDWKALRDNLAKLEYR